MLSTCGVFWTGEGLGAAWPVGDLALLWIFALFAAIAVGVVRLLPRHDVRLGAGA